jgi:quercetin dioxygenase-like cupin family protein
MGWRAARYSSWHNLLEIACYLTLCQQYVGSSIYRWPTALKPSDERPRREQRAVRYVRPFETSQIEPGSAGPWLINAEEHLGISARVRRGNGAAAPVAGSGERFLQLIEGEVSVCSSAGTFTAKTPEAVFIPAGVAAEAKASVDSLWLEVSAEITEASLTDPVHIGIDQSKFIGTGFAYQPMIDRKEGAHSMRVNVLHVQPGTGSPDFHIHAFAQIYLIQEGEMTVDVGRALQSSCIEPCRPSRRRCASQLQCVTVH